MDGIRTARQLAPSMRRMSSIPEQHARPVPERNGATAFAERLFRRYLTGSETDYPEALLVFREEEERELQQAAGEVKLTQLIFQTLLQLNEYLLPSSGENQVAFSLLVRNAENILKVIRTEETHRIGTELLREMTLSHTGSTPETEGISVKRIEERAELLMERLILTEQTQRTIESAQKKFAEESARMGFPIQQETGILINEQGEFPVTAQTANGAAREIGQAISSVKTATVKQTASPTGYRRLMAQGRQHGWRIAFHRQNGVVFSQANEERHFLRQKHQLTSYLMELSEEERQTVWQTILQRAPSLVQRLATENMPRTVTERLTELVEQSSGMRYRQLSDTVFLWMQSQEKKQLTMEEQVEKEILSKRTERLEQVAPALRLLRKFLQGGNAGRDAWRETLAKIPSKATVALHQLVEESGLYQVDGTGRKPNKRYQKGADVPTLFTGNRESFLRLQRFLQWSETQRRESLLRQSSELTKQTELLEIKRALHEVRKPEAVQLQKSSLTAQRSTLTLLNFLAKRQEESEKGFRGVLPQRQGDTNARNQRKAGAFSTTLKENVENSPVIFQQKEITSAPYEGAELSFVLHPWTEQTEEETAIPPNHISGWEADVQRVTKKLVASEIGMQEKSQRTGADTKLLSAKMPSLREAIRGRRETQPSEAVKGKLPDRKNIFHVQLDVSEESRNRHPLTDQKKAVPPLSFGEVIFQQAINTALTVWKNQEEMLLHSAGKGMPVKSAEEQWQSQRGKTVAARFQDQRTVLREQIRRQQVFEKIKSYNGEPGVLGHEREVGSGKVVPIGRSFNRDFSLKKFLMVREIHRMVGHTTAIWNSHEQENVPDQLLAEMVETARTHRLMEQSTVDIQQEVETVFKQKLKKLFSRVVVQDRETLLGEKAGSIFQGQKLGFNGLLPVLQQFRDRFTMQRILQRESVLRSRQEEKQTSSGERLPALHPLSYKNTIRREHLHEDVFSQSATEKLLSRLETVHEIRQVRRQGQEAEKQRHSKAPNQGNPPSTAAEVLAVLHRKGQEVSQFLPVFRRSERMPEDFAQRNNPEQMTFAGRNRLSNSVETEEKWKLLEKRLSEQVVSHSSSAFLQSIGTEHPLSLRQNITTFSMMEQGRNSNAAMIHDHMAAIGGQQHILSSQTAAQNKVQKKAEKALENVTELVQKFSAPPPPFRETLGEAVKTVLQSEQLMDNRTYSYEREQELAFRRETPETAEPIIDTAVTEQTVKHSAELRLLSGKTGEQEKLLSVQQETIEGLQSRLKEQEALVKKALENRQSTGSTEPGEVRRIAKAVMQELEEKIKLERQRRGMF